METVPIPMGKDKYTKEELKKQRALEAQFNAAKLKSSTLAEATEWRDCFTLALKDAKKAEKNKKKPSKKVESDHGEEDESET